VFDEDIDAVVARVCDAEDPFTFVSGAVNTQGYSVPAYAPGASSPGDGPVVIAVGPLAGIYIEAFEAFRASVVPICGRYRSYRSNAILCLQNCARRLPEGRICSWPRNNAPRQLRFELALHLVESACDWPLSPPVCPRSSIRSLRVATISAAPIGRPRCSQRWRIDDDPTLTAFAAPGGNSRRGPAANGTTPTLTAFAAPRGIAPGGPARVERPAHCVRAPRGRTVPFVRPGGH
jgi:hypothetical protein